MNIPNTIPLQYVDPNQEFWVGKAEGINPNRPLFGETEQVFPGTIIGPKAAVKHDDGKTDWSLVPFEALEGMADVLSFGAKKYASWNWTEGGGFSYSRVLRSCLRHLFAFMRGQDNDPESGLSHISHAQCNLLFLAYYIRDKKKFSKDDRNVR